MMKMKRYALLLAGLMLISLAGCGKQTPPLTVTDNQSSAGISADVPSTAETSDDITAEESAPPAAELELPAITEPNSSQTAEEKTQEMSPKENVVTPPPAQSEYPRKTESPKQTELPEPETPKTTSSQPVQPQTPAPTESEPPIEPPSEESQEPEFDVGYWVSFAKSYAESIGLELDSQAVSCWDNPIIASASSKYLERDLCGMLNKYNRDEDITAVWIWAEPRTASSWDIYIGYA